jgi:hypothetical protein
MEFVNCVQEGLRISVILQLRYRMTLIRNKNKASAFLPLRVQ